MIRAVIFDLDGTLVQTESLKALSYARAVQALAPEPIPESAVVRAFKVVVGRSRQEVAEYLLEKFDVAEPARREMQQLGVWAPWQALVQIRLTIYQQMLEDPQLLQQYRCPYNVGLLQAVRERGLKTGLATMSYCRQARKVLEFLGIDDAFDFVATRDDVEHGKPDPEIYRLVARQLGVPPQTCLVIEDSPAGIRAALDAGMRCIAVTTDMTREAVHKSGLLEARSIVDDPRDLQSVADVFLQMSQDER